MTSDTGKNFDQFAGPVDEEAIGIDRPGLHPDLPGMRPHNEAFTDVLARNMARRSFLLGAAASVPVLITSGSIGSQLAEAAFRDGLNFRPIAPSTADNIIVPENYWYNVLIRWGDPLFPSAPAFNPNGITAAAQRQQFGFNCDFVGYFKLQGDTRALMCVNHEYTTGIDIFGTTFVAGVVKEQADIEIAAHGGSVVEIVYGENGWRYLRNSKYNRRITGDTPMTITGPAAGHSLMKTSDDPSGRRVLGMLNNCSGGKTPWGTWLTCEENFNQYFANNSQVTDASIKAAHTRYGVTSGATGRKWENFYNRFNCAIEPNEPFRFGWVVEINPYDPTFVPRKRTALGRAKHEAATVTLAKSGQAVVYMGDDQQFDYVYKFVSRRAYREKDEENFRILDSGTLYVAKFNDDNTGTWIPLSMENPTLSALYSSDGEILIKTRLAADAVGATAMDRPEDVQPNPVNGKVYLTMTNNSARTSIVSDTGSAKANPRVPNLAGHIIELSESSNDAAATTFTWQIFLLCGNPTLNLKTSTSSLTAGLASNATFFAGYADASKLGKIAAPDNIAFDNRGNLWIATDGQPSNSDIGRPNDALHAVPTDGPERGYLRQFLSGPKGCEICGPEFSDDNRTLFCAVQHPGEDGGVPNTISTWPDGTTVPRPSVVAVRHRDGRAIGS